MAWLPGARRVRATDPLAERSAQRLAQHLAEPLARQLAHHLADSEAGGLFGRFAECMRGLLAATVLFALAGLLTEAGAQQAAPTPLTPSVTTSATPTTPATTPTQAQRQSAVGLWETISDVDGRPSGRVRIREVQGELLGSVEQIADPGKRDGRCVKCTDERRNALVLGLTVLRGMHADGERYSGGKILDPDNGKVYSCRMTLIDGGKRLQVRGYIGIPLLGRTQTWNRLE
jgi:uncharacterized protein (DUF2147 family)